MTRSPAPQIAVLIPCLNEEAAIASVVADFQGHFPDAAVYVYDNNSTDNTVDVARAAGAIVQHEPQQGKGHVVRRMFADIDADIYILVDGDGTYDAASAPAMVQQLLDERQDMVSGARKHTEREAYRAGHVFGNTLLSSLLGILFRQNVMTDILSGYRVFSHRFVKSFPALSTGFETETELTVHALELNMPISEVETAYFARVADSESKLSTYKDGLRILFTMLRMFEKERPMVFYGSLFLLSWLAALLLGIPIVLEFAETGLVPRIPTVSAVVGLSIFGFVSLVAGLISDSVALGRKEMKRLFYLSTAQFGDFDTSKRGSSQDSQA